MQAAAKIDRLGGDEAAQLADSLVVRAGGAADEPARADAQDVAAVDGARLFDESDLAVVAQHLGDIIISGLYPRTMERLVAAGLDVRTVDASELAKAEGGVTCCSIIV